MPIVETLEGVDLWDGRAHRGPATLRLAAAGADAVVAAVEPAAAASSGLSVVPGLIDTHVHLIGESTGARVDFLTWPLTTRVEERVLHGLANARRALAAGVTTLRDLAADDVQFSLRRALDAGVVPGPRLVAHGMGGFSQEKARAACRVVGLRMRGHGVPLPPLPGGAFNSSSWAMVPTLTQGPS